MSDNNASIFFPNTYAVAATIGDQIVAKESEKFAGSLRMSGEQPLMTLPIISNVMLLHDSFRPVMVSKANSLKVV